MARRLKIDLLCSPQDRTWLGEQIQAGKTPALLAGSLRRLGYDWAVARDVVNWAAVTFGAGRHNFRTPTIDDRYCATIERMHEFCDERNLPFKASMVDAIETWMEVSR